MVFWSSTPSFLHLTAGHPGQTSDKREADRQSSSEQSPIVDTAMKFSRSLILWMQGDISNLIQYPAPTDN